MSARVAVRALPADMPSFFRAAVEDLAYQCPEPDRWRDVVKTPTLTALTRPDHWMKLENVPPGLPPTRYEFVLANSGRKNAHGRALTVMDLGTAVYAVAEWSEMLTVGFRLWRNASDANRPRIERNIVHDAGVLCHWITDTAQPLHASVHTNGWDAEFPNPQEFSGKGIHGRFESAYVDKNIAEADIAAVVSPVRPIGDWLQEAERHVRASLTHVETIYRWDKSTPFGSGQEPAEAKPFTARRLAAGAQLLRDFWYSAWTKSQ
jgi:hypothetical protein